MAVESEGEYRLVGLALEFFLLTSALSGSTAFQSRLHKCVFHPINFKAVTKELPVHVYFAKKHRLQIIRRLYNKDEAASSTLHNYYTAVCVCSLVQ